MTRRSYAWGYKTRDDAQSALEDMFAASEVSECEMPQISAYKTRHLVTGQPALRYQITVAA